MDSSQGGIEFEPATAHAAHGIVLAQGPRFDVPGPMMRTVRDPALSLMALSGLDPVGPVMVEVPPVQDNSALTTPPALAGWRIGFADEYLRGGERETAEHSSAFLRALEVLRTAGAQLVPVSALIPDTALHFTTDLSNEIDERVAEHRLDALVSDEQSPAFHASCKTGYPGISLPLSNTGVAIWFYGARWARDSLSVLVRAYQKVLLQNDPVQGRE
ncbi:amidase family protein [Pseudomonas sp. 15FMM2]|uniref:Amidase family protein n=1 Tax=Pseudomonas imrae TaxID=2992837 RepID=A0ACC7P998_9PSED